MKYIFINIVIEFKVNPNHENTFLVVKITSHFIMTNLCPTQIMLKPITNMIVCRDVAMEKHRAMRKEIKYKCNNKYVH
jgi:hypothetical protein